MGQAEKQKEVFLSVCGQHDYNLLTGKEAMTQTDFERITYILWLWAILPIRRN